MNKIIRYAPLVGFLLIGLVIFLRWPYVSEQTAVQTFDIPTDFDTVRKVVVRTDFLEKAMEEHGTILEKRWSGFTIASDRIFNNPNWMLETDGTFKLCVKTPFGDRILDLKNHNTVTPDSVGGETSLILPVKELENYYCKLKLVRNGYQTRAQVICTVKIKCRIPNLPVAHAKADEEVQKAAAQGVADLQRAFGKIDQYKGKPLLFQFKAQ